MAESFDNKDSRIEVSLTEIVKEYLVSVQYDIHIQIKVIKWRNDVASDKGYLAIPNIMIKNSDYPILSFTGLEPRYLTLEHAVKQAISQALHGYNRDSDQKPVIEPNPCWIRYFENHNLK